jgi:transmembrane sensor
MSKNKARRAIIKEASDWVVRLHEPGHAADERKQFVRWLKRSPLHVHEFLQTEADWLALEDIDAGHAIDIAALLGAPDGTVVPFSGKDRAAPQRGARRGLFFPLGLAAAAALAAVLLLVQYVLPETYATALGEQRTVVLADGSIVELNTQSRIRVRVTDDHRDIDLIAGEALFTVADDPARPFRVFSDSVEVRAVGTQFNVYRQPAQTVVTVLEGHVEVRNREPDDRRESSAGAGAGSPAAVGLAAGDRAVAHATAIARSAIENPRRAVAWRERRLVFEDDPLADVAAEFNRYNSRRIVLDDDALAARRINGVFDADRPEAIVQFLVRNNDAEVAEQSGARWVLRSKP